MIILKSKLMFEEQKEKSAKERSVEGWVSTSVY